MQIKNSKFFKAVAIVAAFVMSIMGLSLSAVSASASPTPVAFTVERAGWNVVGLDSNDVTDGPNQFPQGIKVCNTSSGLDASDVDITWNWTNATNAAYITLDGASTKTVPSLAAGACTTVWWTVTVARNNASYDKSRSYTVTATDGTATATSTSQLVYVEHLVSQNRNVVRTVTGPTSVTLGDTVTFVLTGATATQGYEQIVTAPILSSALFEITSITGTYDVGGSVSNFYFNGCNWDPAGYDVSTWNCLATGKAGGDPITITVTAKAVGLGTAQVGGVIYDFSGSSFHYNSDYADSDFSVTVSAPVASVDAVDDAETTSVDTPVDLNVLANDTATHDTLDPTSVVITQLPAHGTLSVNPSTGVVTYTPDAGWYGVDTFKYTVKATGDPSKLDEATGTVTIPAPSTGPTAVDDVDTTPMETPVVVDVLDNDTQGTETLDPSSVNVTSGPSNGTVSVNPTTGEITYTPGPEFTGVDTFTYEICDTGASERCDTATVTITVAAPNTPPTAVDDVDDTLIDTPVDVAVLDNDIEGSANLDPNAVTVTTPPSHGTATVQPLTGEIRYLPDTGWFGTDTFYYQVCDLNDPQQCDIAKVTITVPEGPAPLTGPDAVNDADSTAINTPVEVDVLGNDDGGTGDLVPSTVRVTVDPAHGTATVDPATGKITYTPSENFWGEDVLTYEVCNDNLPQLCDTATVTITIPQPAAPEATDDADSTPFETPVEIDVLHNDTPGGLPLNPGSVNVTDGPAHGTVTVDPATGKITYTPADGFSGTDTFTYQVCDTGSPATCVIADVTVVVAAEQHAGDPAASDDEAETKLDTPVEIDVLNNDTPGATPLDPASVKVTHDPEHGTVTIDPATGKITFTPTKGFSGEDTFTYEVCDTADPANCVSAVVTVVIKPDAKVAVDEVSTVDKQIVIDPSTLDPNAPAIDPTTVEIVDQPSHGTVEVDPVTGKITYTPEPGYKGTDSFTFRASQLSDPTAFVDYKYNLYLAGEESTSEVEKNAEDTQELAFTGSEPWLPVAAGAVLVAVGLVVRRRKA